MALHQISRPHLPILEQLIETLETVPFLMPSEQFGRGRWGTGARVEHGNVHFATRERLIKNREITNHQGEQPKAQTRLNHRQSSGRRSARCDIAETQGEESRAAIVEIGKKTSISNGQIKTRSGGPMEQGETEDQRHGPNYQ